MIATYASGNAYAVLARDVAVLARDISPDVVAALWASLADASDSAPSPDVMQLLDLLSPTGLATMPEFAAVLHTATEVRVITRGAGIATLALASGSRTCDATGVSTWSEQHFSAGEVSRVRLSLGTESEGEVLHLTAGVVRASGLDILIDVQPASPPPASLEPAEAEGPEPEPDPKPTSVSRPASSESKPGHGPAPRLDSASPAHFESPGDPSETMVEPDEASFDALFGATVTGRRPEDAAIRSVEDPEWVGPPSPAEVPDDTGVAPPRPGDHDDRTMTPDQFARLRAGSRNGTDTGGGTTSQSDRPCARLLLSTGREVVFDRPVLLGRSPQTRNTSSAGLPILVVVDDPYVSGTHLELSFVGAVLHATDMSSNGTLLRRPGAARPEPMPKYQATAIPDGGVLHVSDDLSIQVSVP